MGKLSAGFDWLPVFALDRVSDYVIVTDADFALPDGPRIIFVNRALVEATGYSEAELIGRSPRIFQGEGTDRATLGRIKQALLAGESVREEVLNYTKSGHPYWTELNIAPVTAPSGDIQLFLSVQRDITEQRQVAAALTQSLNRQSWVERHFASARLAARIGVFDYSVGQDLQYWSDELIEMTGLAADTFPAPSERFIDGIDKADRPLFDALLTRAVEQGEDYSITVQFRRPDGRAMHMHIIAEVHDDEDGDRRIVGIARDVTEEVAASTRLRMQEERFRIIAGSVSDVLWDYHIAQDEFWVSPDWAAKLGLVQGTAPFVPARWVDSLAPEHRAATWNSLIAALKSRDESWRHEFAIVDDAGTAATIAINATILRGDDGRAYRMLGNLRNVTHEKREQEGRTRARALEAVGKMTGGIAHDFNNLLMIIQGNAEILGLSALDAQDREAVQLIARASEAAANLTAKLLSFSGQTRLDNACLDIRDLMTSLVPLLQSGLTSHFAVKTDIAADIWTITVDAGALEQAIINLAVNARDAMPQGGTITIAAHNHVADEDMIGASHDLAAGRYVCISVTDSGEGMSAATIAKACEPFFTTKEVGKGTGLGLSSAYGFVRQSGGALHIYSEQGRGSIIKLYLPVGPDSASPCAKVADGASEPLPAGRRVLVVEDQPEVRSHVEKLLRRAGFAVTSADNAPNALAILDQVRDGKDRFDVLFTDVIMPGGMNGVQLAAAAARIAPDMKVLFTSGFPASAFEDVGITAWESFDLLQKPYKSADLVQAMKALF